MVAGRITTADWVRLCAEAPARTFWMWPTKGNLRVGADADVVVWNPQRRHSLAASALHMNVDHSPYEDVRAFRDRSDHGARTDRSRSSRLEREFTGWPSERRRSPGKAGADRRDHEGVHLWTPEVASDPVGP